jgi:hypothetical protein
VKFQVKFQIHLGFVRRIIDSSYRLLLWFKQNVFAITTNATSVSKYLCQRLFIWEKKSTRERSEVKSFFHTFSLIMVRIGLINVSYIVLTLVFPFSIMKLSKK